MKQQILSTVAALLSATALFAQLPVSQTSSNKSVVLEEFTGIYCTFCPEGHKLAQAIKTANPTKVVLINIHAGNYAAPSAGDPDFRTNFGQAIANQSNLSGYPSGTVNRHVFEGSSTALGRGKWSVYAPTILSQASYANIALEASLDVVTRELTVDVEIYYTGDGATANNLNVALLQSGIEGPQTGMNANPAQILPNGKYEHNHMLRHLLTGQWGEEITTTTSGTLLQRQYVYTIPANLKGIDFNLGDLEIVAFLAEGKQEIITGAEGPINYVLPTGIELIDLAATTSMQVPSDYCTVAVTPEITVKNNETASVSTYEVSYRLNGGASVTQTVSNPLAGGASETITFPSINLPLGKNKIAYWTNLVSGTPYIEITNGNNLISSKIMNIVPQATFATTHQEGFEAVTTGQSLFVNAILDNPQESGVFVVDKTSATGVTQNLGGFGNSSKSLIWNFYAIPGGKEASLVFHKMDFSTGVNYGVTFNHAYAQYSNESDKLQVLVSTDCGANWTSVFSKQGTNLKTSPSVNTGNFFPSITQWESNYVDLSAYQGQSEVMIAFKGTSGYGNNLYLDDIYISTGVIASLEENNELNNQLTIYPNPSNTGYFTVNAETTIDNIILLDMMGREISVPTNLETGAVDASNLKAGNYILKVMTKNLVQTKQIVITK